MRHVIIVNGTPDSGKTTFELYCKDFIYNVIEDDSIIINSSITPIKEICRLLGWDGVKTDYWRSVMSYLKKIWSDTCDGPTKYLLNNVLNVEDNEYNDVWFFFDIRESNEIHKLVKVLSELSILGIKCYTVIIKRPDVLRSYGNTSDDDVENYTYDYEIVNDSSIDHFKNLAQNFIDKIKKGEI